MKKENLLKHSNFLVTSIFLTAMALDLMVNESDKLIKRIEPEGGWKREKKLLFSRYKESIARACIYSEEILQDLYSADEQYNFKNIQIWQEEANELARYILMIADRTSNLENIQKIHAFIRSIDGEGGCDEELLSKFYLAKRNDRG